MSISALAENQLVASAVNLLPVVAEKLLVVIRGDHGVNQTHFTFAKVKSESAMTLATTQTLPPNLHVRLTRSMDAVRQTSQEKQNEPARNHAKFSFQDFV